MNCDTVFDYLTRGPFPSGQTEQDELVEMHLQRCDDCRQLAHALEPAVELFHESMSGDECTELPGYWGNLFDDSLSDIAEYDPPLNAAPDASPETMLKVAPAVNQLPGSLLQGSSQSSWLSSLRVLSIALTIMISVSLSLSLSYWLQPTSPVENTSNAANHSSMNQLASLDAMGLTTACLLPPKQNTSVSLLMNNAEVSPVSYVDSPDSQTEMASLLVPQNQEDEVIHLPKDYFQGSVGVAQLHCCTYCHQAGSSNRTKTNAGNSNAPKNPHHVSTQHSLALAGRIAQSCALCHVSFQ